MFYNIEICVYPFIFLKNTSFCYPGITNIWRNVRLVRDRKEATGMSPSLYGSIFSEDKGDFFGGKRYLPGAFGFSGNTKDGLGKMPPR